MKLLTAALAAAFAFTLTPAAPATAATTSSHLECQYEVYRGQLYVEAYQVSAVGGTTRAVVDRVPNRLFSTQVENYAHTKRVTFHVRSTSHWGHGVYRTYSYGNVKAWVSGVRCETV